MPLLYLHRFSYAFTVAILLSLPFSTHSFDFTEATVDSIHQAFTNHSLTSVQLVQHYLSIIRNLNQLLRAVIEVNPDALTQAARADLDRESTNGIGSKERDAISNMAQLSSNGIETLMREKQLDAIVTPDSTVSSILAIGGYPGISVPAGYDKAGVPFGICFGGLKGFEPKLIEIAYAFEQATKVREPPHFSSPMSMCPSSDLK